MKLSPPFEISSRLLPAVRVGDGTISITYDKKPGDDGRVRYRYYIDAPGIKFTGNDLQSGVGGGTLQEGMASILSFLSAAAEAANPRYGRESENANLFPKKVNAWAYQNDDEIGMLSFALNENRNLITD